jgi:hypothetical protein
MTNRGKDGAAAVSDSRVLFVEVACRQDAARRLLVAALTRPDLDSSLLVWAAWVKLERLLPLVELLLADSSVGEAA